MPDRSLRLKPLPTLNTRFCLALVALVLLSTAVAAAVAGQHLGSVPVWVGYGVVLTVALAGCIVANQRRGNAGELTLHGHRLTVPAPRGFGRSAVTVDVADLHSIELAHRGGPVLTVGIPGHFPVAVRGRDLRRGDLLVFHDRLWSLGASLNPELGRARALFERRNRVPAAALLTALVLTTVFLTHRGGDDHPVHNLIALGGLNDWLVAHGEVHRLGAAALLHADWLHLAINLAFLLVIGLRLEYVTGSWTFAATLGIGMLTGNVAAYLAGGHTVVIGASGGVFALFGLYAVTLWQRQRHLPSRTRFAPHRYLLAALPVLFVPLPGHATSVHLGGFLGGALWSLAAARQEHTRSGALWLGAVAWIFVAVAGGYAFAHKNAWLAREDTLIERMAADPDAGIGTLDLVGWYALRHQDRRLQAVAAVRLEGHDDHTASSLDTMAELLLSLGHPRRAAGFAHAAFERRSTGESRARLLHAELAAYAANCRPADYTREGTPPPLPVREGAAVAFASEQPLYVHALLDDVYLMVRTGLPVPAAGNGDVTVLGYSDRLPWRRKPWVLRVPHAGTPDCGAARE